MDRPWRGRGSLGRSVAFGIASAATLTALLDTSVLIDYLRGHAGAAAVLEQQRASARLHASEITRLEILSGMRGGEEDETRLLLSTLVFHTVDAEVAEEAGALGRQWLPSHHTIDAADLAIAATATRNSLELLTRNVRHFPMFDGLKAPY